MNENLNLLKILNDCPKGTKLYSTLFGDVELVGVCKSEEDAFPIEAKRSDGTIVTFMKNGRFYFGYGGECTLFPSRDQRDWSKFIAPWLKKERFDPKTLNVFDKVLVKISDETFNTWYADFVAEPSHVKNETPLIIGAKEANMVLPYNDDTKHLVSTTEEAPEYYRYWED